MARHVKVVATLYDKRGKVISIGINSYKKTHPKQFRLAFSVGLKEKIYLHAEVDAIVKNKKRKAYRIVIKRFDFRGKETMAKPCPICQRAIEEAGIKIVEYTTW